MFNHEIYATSFARAVDLLRDPRATKEQQKSALRALVALAGLSSATLRVYDGALSVDDVAIPPELPGVAALTDRLAGHGLAEVIVGKGAEPRELLALLRFLAGPPGGRSVKELLRDADSRRVMVILSETARPSGPMRRPPSVTQAFELDQIAALGTPEVPQATPAAPALDWDAVIAANAMTEIDLGFTSDAPAAAAPAAEPPAVAPAPIPGRPPHVSAVETALADLRANPYGGTILDRLTRLSDLVQKALSEDAPDDALRLLAALVELEPSAPEGTPRNSYGIVLRRILTRETLALLAPHALDEHLGPSVAVVMRRAKGDAAEVLLGLLANSKVRRERFAYLEVLKSMPQGLDQVIHMLGHEQWFVVRNVADLMGDVRLEESVPELGRLLAHHDGRVRLSAAIALAKIGTASTVEPLRRAMKAGEPDVRIQILSGIGRASRALAMPLVTLIEVETNPDVTREAFAALGRIGSPEAVQALAKSAEPGGRLVGRKSAASRVAAVEGLRLAGATRVLQSLADDADGQVKDAARRALDELKART